MGGDDHRPPGLGTLVRQLAHTGLGALNNRAELLAVEWQEEKARQTGLLGLTVAFVFLGAAALGLVTAIVIFLCPPGSRIYVAGGFALLYAAGAVWAGLRVKAKLNEAPFSESLNQLKKDREWLESLR